MMRIWLTTDTHFGHDNMIPYCGRPVDFSTRIMQGLRKSVESGDMLIHLGDICIGEDAKWHEFIASLPGKKVLVRGNHDQKSNSWYLAHGWDFVCETFSLKTDGKRILFSHEPKYLNRNDFNIHGHFHNQLNRLKKRDWVVEGEAERNNEVLKILTLNHICLSLEETHYQPVLLKTFLKDYINTIDSSVMV